MVPRRRRGACRRARDLLLGGAGWRDVLPAVGVLIAFVVVMLPLALLAFRSCVGTARRHGLLGTY